MLDAKQLMLAIDEFGYSQRLISLRFGVSPGAVNNSTYICSRRPIRRRLTFQSTGAEDPEVKVRVDEVRSARKIVGRQK